MSQEEEPPKNKLIISSGDKISKIEGQTNNNSYALLVIGKQEQEPIQGKIYGKVDFKNIHPNSQLGIKPWVNGYVNANNQQAALNFKYIQSLDVLSETQLDKNKNILTLKYDAKITDSGTDITKITRIINVNKTLSTDGNDYYFHSEFLGAAPVPVFATSLFVSPKFGLAKEFQHNIFNVKKISFTSVTYGGCIKKRTNYKKMTLKELKQMAKLLNVKGRSSTDKDVLVDLIKNHKKKKSKSNK